MFRMFTIYTSLMFLMSGCLHQSELFKNITDPSSALASDLNTNTDTNVNTAFVKTKAKEVSDYTNTQKSSIYGEAQTLISTGQMDKAEALLQKISPQHQPSNTLLKRLEAPFNLALKSVEDYIQEWLLRPTEVAPIALAEPTLPTLPKPLVIAKGEFETTKQFNIRLEKQKSIYQETLNSIKQNYAQTVSAYNTAVKSHNSEIHWEQKRRQEQVLSMRSRLLNVSVNEVLGVPSLTDVEYNADKEIFTAKVVASDTLIHYDVIIPVSIAEAPAFKRDSNTLEVQIKMNFEGGIKPLSFKINNSEKSYVAYLADSIGVDEFTKQRSAGVAEIDFNDIKINKADTLKVEGIIDNNKQYFKKLF